MDGFLAVFSFCVLHVGAGTGCLGAEVVTAHSDVYIFCGPMRMC